jgi:hypothetical protein
LLAAALLALPGSASATVQGGASPVQTASPDVISAAVTSTFEGTVCFDADVRAPSSGPFDLVPVRLSDGAAAFSETGSNGTFVRGIHARSYGLTGSLAPQQPVITNPIIAEPEGNCLRLFFLPIWGAGLADNTVIEVEPGAVQDAAGRPNTPGSAALDGSTLVPLKGQTTGPKLLRAVPNDQARTVTYIYAAPVLPLPACGVGQPAACPTGVMPSLFGYYTADRNPDGARKGEAIVGSGPNSVTVRFPQAGADASPEQGTRFFSMPGAVVRNNPNAAYPSSLDVVGRNGGNGAATDRPDLQRATPVPGLPGVYDLRYDQAVITPNQAPGILPGCLAVPENPLAKGVQLNIPGVGMIGHSLGRPGRDAKTVRISFNQMAGSAVTPGVEALQDSKIVRIIDLGDGAALGCAVSLQTGLTSSRGEGDVRTAPMQKGFTEGPDLTAVTIDKGAGTISFIFDEVVAPSTWLKGHAVAAPAAGGTSVGALLSPLGDLVNDARPAAMVVVEARPDQLDDAAGGLILSGGVFAGLPVALGSNLGAEDLVPSLGLPTTQLPSPGSPAVGDYTGAPALNQAAGGLPTRPQ